MHPVKLEHSKIPEISKILVYWEPKPYSEYRESIA